MNARTTLNGLVSCEAGIGQIDGHGPPRPIETSSHEGQTSHDAPQGSPHDPIASDCDERCGSIGSALPAR